MKVKSIQQNNEESFREINLNSACGNWQQIKILGPPADPETYVLLVLVV